MNVKFGMSVECVWGVHKWEPKGFRVLSLGLGPIRTPLIKGSPKKGHQTVGIPYGGTNAFIRENFRPWRA